jgi:hypothetical protein
MKHEGILNLLQRCRRQWYKPDLHSFKARIKDGVVFVDCDQDGVNIDAITYDKKGNEIHESWRTGRALCDAVEILAQLEIDLVTVET